MATRKKQVVPRQNKTCRRTASEQRCYLKADYQNKAADVHARKLNPIYIKWSIYTIIIDVMLSGKNEIDSWLVTLCR
jgi:hypothetical protein